jgi:hypothetical protein
MEGLREEASGGSDMFVARRMILFSRIPERA